ncbi:MAG: hypothetical protein JKY37_13710 [Nannocystaceae bacterium]|nr:hypothetical protein [Nannocystaceae bacterium]
MPKVDHGKHYEPTALLEVESVTSSLDCLSPFVPDLLVPGNRERGACSGAFDVGASEHVPPDYEHFAHRYPQPRLAAAS